MRVVVQRVRFAKVTVSGEVTGAIGRGLLILAGFRATDTEAELVWMAKKCASLRIFADADGRMNRSLQDVEGDALVVSQFTLYGDASKGNRPSFSDAAPPSAAEAHYTRFCGLLGEALGRPVATGRFGAMMDVELLNDGPVTISIDREAGAV